ncbi:GNAT family N-acetyltransferase [Paenibacillus wulumuqiensis]|uniref:GNAT family N-acetyltransferase n=1 Tax=Paenibacillus wulumuqiensis TaxID=1567107 RepID=UPI0006193D53|nr:GNAT family N-acetyltransferase [Paenibacillus wulumuqiensis]
MTAHDLAGYSVLSISQIPRKDIEDFFVENWGSPEMVISSGTYNCLELEGYAALAADGSICGLVTWVIEMEDRQVEHKVCELISLDSLRQGKGIGSQLLKQAEYTAAAAGCTEMQLITTNDNLQALEFYQKRGYVLTALYPDAVSHARLYKPSIPLVADNGIPIRDELLLSKRL